MFMIYFGKERSWFKEGAHLVVPAISIESCGGAFRMAELSIKIICCTEFRVTANFCPTPSTLYSNRIDVIIYGRRI